MNAPTIIPIAPDLKLPVWKRHFLIPGLSAAVVFIGLCFAQIFVAAVVVSLGLGVLTFLLIRRFDGSRRVTFTVDRGKLEVRGDMFAESFTLSELNLEAAEALDLTQDRERALKWKTFGTGLPGYYSGEYTLRNGRAAIVFIADRTRVLIIPRGRAPALMLSVAEPETFKALLISARDASTPAPVS